jgi:hypothetical protein
MPPVDDAWWQKMLATPLDPAWQPRLGRAAESGSMLQKKYIGSLGQPASGSHGFRNNF